MMKQIPDVTYEQVETVNNIRALLKQDDVVYGDFHRMTNCCGIASQSQSGKAMQRRGIMAWGLEPYHGKEVDAIATAGKHRGKTHEIKTTRMDNDVMMFQEIRLAAGADFYDLVAYRCGRKKPTCVVFVVPADAMAKILLRHGAASHGDGEANRDPRLRNHGIQCRKGDAVYKQLLPWKSATYARKLVKLKHDGAGALHHEIGKQAQTDAISILARRGIPASKFREYFMREWCRQMKQYPESFQWYQQQCRQ